MTLEEIAEEVGDVQPQAARTKVCLKKLVEWVKDTFDFDITLTMAYLITRDVAKRMEALKKKYDLTAT